MMRNAFAKLASGLSIGLLTLGMTFGATQLSIACEGEEFAEAAGELVVAPTPQEEGALVDRVVGRFAIVTEPSVVVTVVASTTEPSPSELSLAEAPAAETGPPTAVEAVETVPAAELTTLLPERRGQTESGRFGARPAIYWLHDQRE